METRFGSIEELIVFISESPVTEVDKLLKKHDFKINPKQATQYRISFDTEFRTSIATVNVSVQCEHMSVSALEMSQKLLKQFKSATPISVENTVSNCLMQSDLNDTLASAA